MKWPFVHKSHQILFATEITEDTEKRLNQSRFCISLCSLCPLWQIILLRCWSVITSFIMTAPESSALNSADAEGGGIRGKGLKMKKPRIAPGLEVVVAYVLDLLDIGGLEALGALHNVKGDALAFLERLETLRLDRGKMYEYIFTVLLLQKTKPLAVIEPLHFTFSHFLLPQPFMSIYPHLLRMLIIVPISEPTVKLIFLFRTVYGIVRH